MHRSGLRHKHLPTDRMLSTISPDSKRHVAGRKHH